MLNILIRLKILKSLNKITQIIYIQFSQHSVYNRILFISLLSIDDLFRINELMLLLLSKD